MDVIVALGPLHGPGPASSHTPAVQQYQKSVYPWESVSEIQSIKGTISEVSFTAKGKAAIRTGSLLCVFMSHIHLLAELQRTVKRRQCLILHTLL